MILKLLVNYLLNTKHLLEANQLTEMTRHQEDEEQIRFTLKSDEQDFYRHSYLEEQKLLNMVRSGNVEEALRLSKGMDVEIGRLGGTELAHCRNLLTVGVTLCARAAIEGGLMPYIAYRLSGFYIHKGMQRLYRPPFPGKDLSGRSGPESGYQSQLSVPAF